MSTSGPSLNAHLDLLKRESAILTVGTAASMLASIVSLAILVKTLPAASLGMLIVINTYPLLVHQVINLQSWQGFIRAAQHCQAQKRSDELAQLVKFFFVLDLIAITAAAAVAVLLAGPLANALGWAPDWVPYLQLFACSLLVNFSSFSLGVLRLYKRYNWQAMCALFGPVAQLIAAVFLYAYQAPIESYLWSWLVIAAVGTSLQLGVAMRTLAKQGLGNWWRAKLRYFDEPLRFTFWVNVATSLDASVKQFDVMLVSAVVSLEAVPIYRFIKQAGVFLYRLADALAQTSYSRMVDLLTEQNLGSALVVLRTVMAWIAPFSLAYLLIVGLSAPYWLGWLFNDSFAANSFELGVYLLIVGTAVVFTPLHQLIYALGYVRIPALATLLAVGAFLILSLAWGAAYGLVGFIAALAIYHLIALCAKLALLVWVRRQRPIVSSEQP